jgi:acyl carrier protein
VKADLAELERVIGERNAMLDTVRVILTDKLGVRREPNEIDPDTPLFGTGLGLDSIDAVELLVSIETEFNIRIPDEVVGRTALRTLNTVVDTVMDVRAAHAGS